MSVTPIAESQSANMPRRYDLDWLRVGAFAVLILYHVGMFYVTWGWHIKSVYAQAWAEPIMSLVNPWRLGLLFFISGVSIRFATDKMQSSLRFASSRLYRLGLPILGGMVVIVAPQSYFELRQSGVIEGDYLSFWGRYLNSDPLLPIATPTWNHLWYVIYLLVYILILAPFLPLLRRFANGAGGKALQFVSANPFTLLTLVAVPFVAYSLLLADRFPVTHDLVNDWQNHAHRFTILLLGYFAAKHRGFWKTVDSALPLAAILTVSLGPVRVLLEQAGVLPPLFGMAPFVYTLLLTLYAWSFIVLLLGIGQRYLNRPSKALKYLTGAVFCYYILHQTITITAGYYLTQLSLGVQAEVLLVTLITFAGCAIGYEAARRFPPVRPWLGIKG